MAFRKRRHDSDGGDSDEERLPINKDDDDDLKSEPAKKSKNIWSDMLHEDQLLEKGQKINLDKASRRQPNYSRGPESYIMPQDEFNRRHAKAGKKQDKQEPPAVFVTSADDNLFGDAPTALDEGFGIKKNEVKLPPQEETNGWWGKKGANKRYADSLNMQDRPQKQPYIPKKTSQLMAGEFSMENMMAAQFDEGLSLDELGNQIGAAMGEKDPDTVKKIVNAIGRELSLKLFNETKEVEQDGGMKITDGSRRRTPGGVFITLFKMDSSVSREIKDGIFDNLRNADKKRSKQKKKEHNFSKQLEDVKKSMDRVAKAEDDVANDELGLNTAVAAPFDDEVVDMS